MSGGPTAHSTPQVAFRRRRASAPEARAEVGAHAAATPALVTSAACASGHGRRRCAGQDGADVGRTTSAGDPYSSTPGAEVCGRSPRGDIAEACCERLLRTRARSDGHCGERHRSSPGCRHNFRLRGATRRCLEGVEDLPSRATIDSVPLQYLSDVRIRNPAGPVTALREPRCALCRRYRRWTMWSRRRSSTPMSKTSLVSTRSTPGTCPIYRRRGQLRPTCACHAVCSSRSRRFRCYRSSST